MEAPPRFHIQSEDLQALPLGHFTGAIHLVDKPELVDAAVLLFKNETILGFDTETKPIFKKGRVNPIALVQVASEKHAALFRINTIGMPAALKNLLEDAKVKKIAQEPLDELQKLQETHHVNARGFINLAVISKAIHCKPSSVKGLTALFLGFRISKSSQTSNWEKICLTPKQLLYAATDAWVCRQIFLEMNRQDLLGGIDANLPDELPARKVSKKKKRKIRVEPKKY